MRSHRTGVGFVYALGPSFGLYYVFLLLSPFKFHFSYGKRYFYWLIDIVSVWYTQRINVLSGIRVVSASGTLRLFG